MLPQFGFIVAQAGADARMAAPAGPPSGLPPPPPSHNSSIASMSNQYRHDGSSVTPPRDRPYYSRHSSPAPPSTTPTTNTTNTTPSSSSSSMPHPPPVLPPPVPYMYAGSDYNYQRPYYPPHPAAATSVPPPPPPSAHPQQVIQQQQHQHQHQPPLSTSSSSASFRPLPPKWRDEPQLMQHHAPSAATVAVPQRPQTPPAPSSVWHAPTPPPPPSQQQFVQQQPPPPQVPQVSQQHVQQSKQQQQQQQKQASSSSSSSTTTTTPAAAAAAAASSFHQHQPKYDYDPYHSHYESQWDQQDDQGGSLSEAHQNKRMRSLRECNDLLTTMNNEFLEHSTVIYHNKLQSLQEELRSIQEGTHEAFMEEIADLEKQREEAIFNAQCLMEYHVSGLKRRYETDVDAAEQDYDLERQHLHDMIVAAIDDRRKMVREDRDNGVDVKELFRDAYHRVSNSKRSLRKRHLDYRSQSAASPSRHENSRRRQTRPSNMYSINGPMSQREEEDLDQEFAFMKGLKRVTAAAQ